MTRSDKIPVSSFGAVLQATLREGARKKLVLKFPTEAMATRFRSRVNGFRAAARRANHPDWEQFYRCGLYKDDDPKHVIIAPRDSEFDDVLVQATGLQTPSPIEVIEHEVKVALPGEEPDPTDVFLSGLRNELTPKK